MSSPHPFVTYSFMDWTGAFGEFSNCSPAQGQGWFNRASILFDNSACNPAACTPGMLSTLLYLLTSHIAWLNAPRDANGNPAATGAPSSPIVGRIDQASEGSVSVHADMGDADAAFPTASWYLSTKYGAEFVAATAGFRTAIAVSQPTFVPGPVYYPGLGYFRGSRGCGVY
jgi:hypothetical protein